MKVARKLNTLPKFLTLTISIIIGFSIHMKEQSAQGQSTTQPAATSNFTDQKAQEMVRVVDDRQRNSGDYKAVAFVKETEKNKEPKLFQTMVYRRDTDNKFMIHFTKPKEEAGKAYLKIDKNLWNFDPNTGKWERRTEREKIGGTNSRRSDYDESRLTDEYNIKAESTGTLGAYQTYMVNCNVKEGVDVAFPIIKLWIDQKEGNLLKREEFALSGKLMRTTFYPKWTKRFSESKKADVYVPEEIRIFDELEKGNSTIIVLKDVDLGKLDENMFTKAWIESKSR